jgi:hypothetical protein
MIVIYLLLNIQITPHEFIIYAIKPTDNKLYLLTFTSVIHLFIKMV